MSTNPPSPSGSMAGWSFKGWLTRNKGDLKLLVSAAAGLATAWVSQHLAGDWAAFIGTVVGVASKMALDAVDYALTNNPQ